ncbi:hypothetical protein FUA48_01615 [Flavobacterium alkalisoli]|uniref:Uncharacterized protein n=1 Tax=Flavobacterium alkalisoli TaxID=2602769 RepID=A0A5B9FRH5_9FLAO|nr:hypothetical protein [Flavobacterium alkalisoli]QEE48318.1 hypothetical protein FUA48_01615 [Flavobacterium alkalisoli]
MKYLFNRNLFFLSGLITILLNSFTASAQSQLTKEETREVVKKMFESSEKINTVVYKMNYQSKSLTQKDTLCTIAVCSLYIAPKDRLKAYHIVEETSAEGKFFSYMKYDGKRTFNVDRLVDSLDVYKEPYIDKGKRMTQQIVQSYSYLLLGEYFALRKSSGKDDSQGANVLITEEMLKDKEVYCITINFKDNEDARDKVNKLYINKSNYLPIGGYFFARWENMEEYNYYEIEYLAINPEISLEKFKVDKNQTINLAERYKVFKEKIKDQG